MYQLVGETSNNLNLVCRLGIQWLPTACHLACDLARLVSDPPVVSGNNLYTVAAGEKKTKKITDGSNTCDFTVEKEMSV